VKVGQEREIEAAELVGESLVTIYAVDADAQDLGL
jgi:hypothetical protein